MCVGFLPQAPNTMQTRGACWPFDHRVCGHWHTGGDHQLLLQGRGARCLEAYLNARQATFFSTSYFRRKGTFSFLSFLNLAFYCPPSQLFQNFHIKKECNLRASKNQKTATTTTKKHPTLLSNRILSLLTFRIE